MIKEKQTDYLLLLVGKNPLPNAVAGSLLAKPGGTILLFHSASTKPQAVALGKWYKKYFDNNISIFNLEINEAKPLRIFQLVQEKLDRHAKEIDPSGKQTIGLNYTGGTKAMAVQAHRSVEKWAQGKRITPIFSYLDARTLTMVYDCDDVGNYVGTSVKMKLRDDLIAIHGWKLQHAPHREPMLFDSASTLAKIYSDKVNAGLWQVFKADFENAEKPDKKEGEKWEKDQKSRFQEIWSEFSKTLQNECGYNFEQSLKFDIRNYIEWLKKIHREIEKYDKDWFSDYEAKILDDGSRETKIDKVGKREGFKGWRKDKWLEHYVLGIVNEVAEEMEFHECWRNVRTEQVDFEVDVIAVRGYQLFAFSCTTSSDKKTLKLKLFEAYTRARQLGGDEARVALVCCSDEPEVIRKELEQEVNQDDGDPSGRIQVFGRRHLSNLKDHILLPKT
ncbi:MAG TPA: hypothetical protein GX519_08060 [Thermoanaerobacterales bacterium]|nr:hypothetical protein [Thermoanaerobacterales bacterium]